MMSLTSSIFNLSFIFLLLQASRAWPSLAGLVPHLPGPVPEPGYAHYHAPHHAVPGYSPAHLDPLQYPANTFAPGMVTPPVSLANVPRWVLLKKIFSTIT